jgi:hypothetical protein
LGPSGPPAGIIGWADERAGAHSAVAAAQRSAASVCRIERFVVKGLDIRPASIPSVN